MRSMFIPAVVFAAAAALPASADIVFQDGTFSNTDWAAIENFGTGSSTSMQMPAGGNPGAHRHITNSLGAGAGALLRSFHHYGVSQATRYEPAVSGAITSLDWSIDFLPISGPTGGQGIAFALKQSQVVYFASPRAVGNTPEWQSHAATLTALDFIRVDGGAGSPNFSNAGAPIRFGLLTYNSANGAGTPFATDAGYDNFVLRIVPAPATATILPFALVAAVRRRMPR